MNSIGCSGARALTESLQKNSSLKYLNLYGNKIDVKGAEYFAEYISSNKSLAYCDLGYNRIRNKGVESINKAIKSNKKCALKILCLKFNFINETSIISIIKTLSDKRYKLNELYIKNNSINDYGLRSL